MKTSSSHRYITFEHSELGTLEVLVTGIREAHGIGLDGFKVYYGAYDITRDLSDEDRNTVLNLAINKESK